MIANQPIRYQPKLDCYIDLFLHWNCLLQGCCLLCERNCSQHKHQQGDSTFSKSWRCVCVDIRRWRARHGSPVNVGGHIYLQVHEEKTDIDTSTTWCVAEDVRTLSSEHSNRVSWRRRFGDWDIRGSIPGKSKEIERCNGDALCFLWGRNWILWLSWQRQTKSCDAFPRFFFVTGHRQVTFKSWKSRDNNRANVPEFVRYAHVF
jgi:hypothetical protein